MLSDIGMRMAAMEYWLCSESGVSVDESLTSVKFLIVESLTEGAWLYSLIFRLKMQAVRPYCFKRFNQQRLVHFVR